MVATPEKCAKPQSDVEATQISPFNVLKVPWDLSNQQKRKVLHAGISKHNGLLLFTGFSSTQENRLEPNTQRISFRALTLWVFIILVVLLIEPRAHALPLS